MGAVNFSIDVSLVEILKGMLPLEIFVETGTLKGDAVHQVHDLFQELYTVESSAEYYERACERFKSDPAIHAFHGPSAKLLAEIMPRLAGRSVLYWLDAHWCGEELATDVSQCPLLDELAAIGHLNEQSVLLIDDARLFLCPPPPPHNAEQWPSLDLVIEGLHSLSRAHEILALNDVFVYFPSSIGNALRNFASRCAIDWLRVLDRARDYNDVLAKFKEFEQTARVEIEALSGEARGKDAEIESLAREAGGKDAEIESLAREAGRKDAEIESLVLEARGKDIEIRNLANQAAEKELQIQRQHADILRLLQEMSDLRRSSSYRLGFALLNPWSSINQKLLKRS